MKVPKVRPSWAMLAIFVAAAVLRAAPVFLHRLDPGCVAVVDSARYLELADRLVAGDGLCLPVRGGAELEPERFRTPGYPVILALAGALPGSRTAWVLGLQILAGAATAALCFVLIRAWVSARAGILAAALVAVDPAQIVYANLLMSDVLCGAAIAAGLTLLEGATGRRAATRRLVAAGLCLSAATALRPVAVLLVLPVTFLLRRRAVAGWPGVAAFAAAALIFPLGWTVRNGLTTGSWTLSTAFDVNLALVAGSRVEARATGLPRGAAEARVMARVAARERASGLPFHRACREVGIDTLRGAPRASLAAAMTAAGEMLLAGERRYLLQVLGVTAAGRTDLRAGAPMSELAGLSRSERLLVVLQAAFMAVVWLFAVAGIACLWRRGQAELALFALAALFVVLAPSLVVGTGRMRLPVAILIHGLAGVGAAGLSRSGPEFRAPATG